MAQPKGGRGQKGVGVLNRVVNRIFFHFPVSEGHNRVDNRIAKITKIIGYIIGNLNK